MGYYDTIKEAKSFLMENGFKISSYIYGEIEYVNNFGDKLTMRKYSDDSCRLW